MQHGPVLLILGLLGAAVFAAPGKAEEKPVTDPKAAKEGVERIEEEYKAIKSSQDLVPARRRRELARRLGLLHCEESAKLLVGIVDEDRDLRARIVAMRSLAVVGKLKQLKRMYSIVNKDRDKVLLHFLGPALSLATDPEAPAWVIDKLLPSAKRAKVSRSITVYPVRMSAVEALGALHAQDARDPLLELLAKELNKYNVKKPPHMIYEVLRSLGQIGGPDVKDELLKAAISLDWRLRLAAAETILVHFRDKAALDAMRALLKDKTMVVREVAAVAVGEAKTEPLIPELILLMREGYRRAKEKSYLALKSVTGQDYGYAPDVWTKWWKDKKRKKLTKDGEIARGERITVSQYYDFEIFSDRMLFVVDVSGSMKWPEYTPHRIDVARKELIKAVKALDKESFFNMATFAGHVNMWQKNGEVLATEDNKKEALKWIKGALLPRGATNTYAALMDGLELNQRIDTMFFLSDGIPSTGKSEVPEEILVDLKYKNRFRKVIINTVAIAFGKASIEKAQKYEDPDEMYAFMKLISDWNGGQCVDLRAPPRVDR